MKESFLAIVGTWNIARTVQLKKAAVQERKGHGCPLGNDQSSYKVTMIPKCCTWGVL